MAASSSSLPPRVASILYLLAFSWNALSSNAFHIIPAIQNHHQNVVSRTKSSMPPFQHPAASAASSTKKRFQSLQIIMSSSRGDGDNNINMPSQEEIAQQKSEAYNAFSSFHETSSSLSSQPSTQIKSLLQGLDTIGIQDHEEEQEEKPEYWSCKEGAITYTVPMDPTAGLKRGIISKPYKSSVQLEMDIEALRGGVKRRGLRLVESIQFIGGGDDSSIPFVRSIALGANVDVDAVDGSYSLDDSIVGVSGDSLPVPLLPPSLLVGVDPMDVKFVVEHTLAVSEEERCRCFLLYGDVSHGILDGTDIEQEEQDVVGEEEDFAVLAAKKAKESSKQKERSERSDKTERNYRLLGVVLAEETKVMTQNQGVKDDEEDYAADFISQMIEESPESPSSPLDLLETNQPDDKSSSEDDKMNRLMQSLDKHNERVVDSAKGSSGGAEPNTKMERHSLGMFGLTAGVWLGDTFVRESIPSAAQLTRVRQSRGQKGFGKNEAIQKDESEEDRFATWHMGVQKVSLQFEWDYYKSISQSYTYGKVMGTATSFSSMANIKSDGMVVVNEARPTKKREDSRVIWDMESGAYVAGLLGSSYFRAPRYMSFSQSRSYSADSFLTEFLVFYRPSVKGGSGGSERKPIDAAAGMDDEEDVALPEYYCSRTSRLYNSNDGSLMQGSTAFFSFKQALLEQ